MIRKFKQWLLWNLQGRPYIRYNKKYDSYMLRLDCDGKIPLYKGLPHEAMGTITYEKAWYDK